MNECRNVVGQGKRNESKVWRGVSIPLSDLPTSPGSPNNHHNSPTSHFFTNIHIPTTVGFLLETPYPNLSSSPFALLFLFQPWVSILLQSWHHKAKETRNRKHIFAHLSPNYPVLFFHTEPGWHFSRILSLRRRIYTALITYPATSMTVGSAS